MFLITEDSKPPSLVTGGFSVFSFNDSVVEALLSSKLELYSKLSIICEFISRSKYMLYIS